MVDLEARTCTSGHPQYSDVPCAHVADVIQTYRSPDGAQARLSAQDSIPFNQTLAVFRATCDGPAMPPVEIATSAPLEKAACHATLFTLVRGHPKPKPTSLLSEPSAWEINLRFPNMRMKSTLTTHVLLVS